MASSNRRGKMMMYMEINKRFHMHMCSEEYLDTEERDEGMEALGKDWKLVRVMFSGEGRQDFARLSFGCAWTLQTKKIFFLV